jgi:hypothetical protein
MGFSGIIVFQFPIPPNTAFVPFASFLVFSFFEQFGPFFCKTQGCQIVYFHTENPNLG